MRRITLLILFGLFVDCLFSANPFIISSYVRGNFYNRGRISAESLNACNDLICIGAEPLSDGNLSLDNFMLFKGKGAASITGLLDSVKSQIKGSDYIKLRLGIAGGKYWKMMIASEDARLNFVNSVREFIVSNSLDGVDLDFEWPQTEEDYDNYSKVIIQLRACLGENYFLTVSLHPLYYKISERAIRAIDYASLQCYGPHPVRFSYDQFVSDIQKLLVYGFPVNKLVAGVPFYGVASDNSKKTVAYFNLVENNLINSPQSDNVSYNNVLYTFNGQDMISRKTQYALSQNLRGMMSWDLATDVPFSDRWSLLKSMVGAVEQ